MTIEVENGCLTVEGKRNELAVEDGEPVRTYHVQEIVVESFSRSFRLPNNLEWDKANATFANGILTVAFVIRRMPNPVES